MLLSHENSSHPEYHLAINIHIPIMSYDTIEI
jgi:hypothetical protein